MNERIKTIIPKAPKVVTEVEILVSGVEAIRTAATGLTQQIKTSHSQFSEPIAVTGEEIEALRQAGSESLNRINNGMNAVRSGIETLNSRIYEIKDEVVSDLSEADESMALFKELIVAGRGAIEGANSETESALDSFFEMIGSSEDDTREVVESSNENPDTLANSLEEAFGQCSDQIANLIDSVEELANQAGVQLSDLVENILGTAAEILVASLEGISEDIAQSVAEIFQQAREDFLEGMMEQINDVSERTADAIGNQVRLVILVEADFCGIERALMEPAVDALTDVIDPIKDALEYIKDLASSF